MLLTIKDVLTQAAVGSQVSLQGWIRTKRISKNVMFIHLQDGSQQELMQVVVSDPLLSDEVLVRALTPGSSIAISGTLVASQGAWQAKEVLASEVRVLGHADSSYPLQPKHHTLAFLRSIQQLRFRSSTFRAVFCVRHAISQAIHHFFDERGFVYLHTPVITSIDAEGAGDLFSVTATQARAKEKGFFGKPAYLTVSGQLAAETATFGLGKVYTFGPTFRAENSNTTRHLAEFWMVEPEMAFYDLTDCMGLAESLLKHVISYVLGRCDEELVFLEERQSQAKDGGIPLREALGAMVADPFVRITYTEAITLLEEASQGDRKRFSYPIKAWGVDLQTEHEQYLVAHFNKPVMVTDYPKAIKAFYMRQNAGGKTVAAMDVLLPRVGEVVGGSQREERYDLLLQAMQDEGIGGQTMDWYLDTRRYGSVVHSGFGLGLERLVQLITGMENIRDVIPFPRTPDHAIA